jgi:hypothetical protein
MDIFHMTHPYEKGILFNNGAWLVDFPSIDQCLKAWDYVKHGICFNYDTWFGNCQVKIIGSDGSCHHVLKQPSEKESFIKDEEE